MRGIGSVVGSVIGSATGCVVRKVIGSMTGSLINGMIGSVTGSVTGRAVVEQGGAEAVAVAAAETAIVTPVGRQAKAIIGPNKDLAATASPPVAGHLNRTTQEGRPL
jgi:phage tail tape-measure protein